MTDTESTQRERDRPTERETDLQKETYNRDRQQRDRQTERETDRQRERSGERDTERQRG